MDSVLSSMVYQVAVFGEAAVIAKTLPTSTYNTRARQMIERDELELLVVVDNETDTLCSIDNGE